MEQELPLQVFGRPSVTMTIFRWEPEGPGDKLLYCAMVEFIPAAISVPVLHRGIAVGAVDDKPGRTHCGIFLMEFVNVVSLVFTATGAW
jgi:hypothetical protein